MRLHGGVCVWLSLLLLPAGYACVCAFGDQWRPETHLSSVTMSMVPVVTLRPSWYLGKSTQGL